MTRLEIIVVVTGVVFILFAIDLYQRRKFNLLHFLVFGWGAALILYFILIPGSLDRFWRTFGLARGADLIVYVSIIFLAYAFINIVNSGTKRDEERTILSRAFAVQNAVWNISSETVCVIPCYGEDYTAIQTITQVIDAWYQAVVVDDGYNEVDFMQELEKYIQAKKLVLITHPINLGQWAALQTWAQWVQKNAPGTKYIVHFDADGQHDINDLPAFKNSFDKNSELDIVMWSRFLGTTTGMWWFRKFHKRLQVWFMRFFVWLNLTDTNNGYRMIKTSALPLLTITSNRMAHASQIEQLIKEHNLSYQEVPVTIKYTEYSKQKGQKLSNALPIVWELFYKWRFYK